MDMIELRGGGAPGNSSLKGFAEYYRSTQGRINNQNQKTAFTLAEVIITLGIIGVVVAMTMPALVEKYEKNITAVRLKKFYSTIQNAANLSVYENGEMADWEFPKRNYDTDIGIFFRKYYLPYLKKSEECDSSGCFRPQKYKITKLDGGDPGGIYVVNYFVKLSDGTYIYFLPNVPNGYIWMYVDLNGHQKPNRIGRDIFVFDIYSYPYRGLTNRKNFKIKFWGSELKTEDLTRAGDYSCSKNPSAFSGFNCGELILRNNWTIPDNYPW